MFHQHNWWFEKNLCFAIWSNFSKLVKQFSERDGLKYSAFSRRRHHRHHRHHHPSSSDSSPTQTLTWGEEGGGEDERWGGGQGLLGGGSGCLKVKGRAANWGGSKLMSFSVASLPRTGGITSPSCQSTSPRPHPPILPSSHPPSHPPTHLIPPSPILLSSLLHCRDGKTGEKKTVYFRTGLLIYLDSA